MTMEGSIGVRIVVLLLLLTTFQSNAVTGLIVNAQQPNSEGSIPAEMAKSRHILVFGGNGMLGSSTVARLIQEGGYNITIVNRGNWYWDSKQRILPHVRTVSCDRKNNVTSCQELTSVVQQIRENNETFSAVLDFSAYGPYDITDALALLSNSVVGLYVYISTDSVYDVTEPSGHKSHEGPGYGCKEEEGVRPEDPYIRDLLANHHEYGNRKLQAEEELVKQRDVDNGTGIPYVILRLPDVLGSRDTTYRFWIYQMWIKLSLILPERPITIPRFLVDYNNSFVYVDDVANLIVDTVLKENEKAKDQVFNVAFPQNVTLQTLLSDIAKELKLEGTLNFTVVEGADSLYLYPTVRRGPINVEKISTLLAWKPTEWHKAIRETVEFYESVMVDERFETQRNEIVQILTGNLYSANKLELYNALEKLYNISLKHFKPKDEL